MMSPVNYPSLPNVQKQLLLCEPRTAYQPFEDGVIPVLRHGELLVQVQAIGLNPIDWKSADFGFAIPQLPCLNGREFVGIVVAQNVPAGSRLTVGDQVLAVATDYRDFRKSAFQEYAVVCCFNAIKIPQGTNPYEAASIGVAFVTAALSLGICLGVVLPAQGKLESLDLVAIAQAQGKDVVPGDCAGEIFDAIPEGSRPHAGEWILIYGASSVTAQLCIQLAKMVGLRVIGVASVAKHGERLRALGVDAVVDRHDLDLAGKEVRKYTGGALRFAMDMIGKDTSTWCQNILASCASRSSSPASDDIPDSFTQKASLLSHLVCLTGSPKVPAPNVRVHQVPVKLFHTNEELGCVLSYWLYHSLRTGGLRLPETTIVEGGLEAVNSCLERMRRGEVSGSRLVVRLR